MQKETCIDMVTFINVGRMGNFLFQAACAMAYAWKHNLESTLPSSTKDPHGNPIYLQHLVNPNWNPSLASVRVPEKGFGFQEIPFLEQWRSKNIVLDGYWQSEKYFKEYRERILAAFGFDWHEHTGVVSVHVRRGDYLTIKRGGMFKHPPVGQQWYEEAMSKFSGYRFKFFSDDIAWCKATFGPRQDCFFSVGNNEVQDLIQGSWCEHQICSASTFSWWQAWLNRNAKKRVVIPSHWITPGWANLYTGDIVPKTWERF